MSTPDASLSAAERAALADLEEAAAAADPGLAALLRGGSSRRIRSDLRLLQAGASRAARAVIDAKWWGIPISVAGICLMVLGLGVALPLSFVGAIVTAAGLAALAEMAEIRLSRWVTARRSPPG